MVYIELSGGQILSDADVDKIGEALGMRRETVFRQYKSGGPINTVKVTHKPEEQ